MDASQGLFQDFAQEGQTHCGKFQEGANPNPKGGHPILNIGKANCQTRPPPPRNKPYIWAPS